MVCFVFVIVVYVCVSRVLIFLVICDCFVNVESMMRLGLLGREFYPERGGVPNCAYYMRTGSCGYGNKCRYNHPRDRNSVS